MKIIRPDEVLVLMESPLYWTMTVKERLALVQQAQLNGGEGEGPGLRQQALDWVKTGGWGRSDKP